VCLALAAVILTGCAGGRLKVGATKDGEVIEAEGWAPVVDDDLLGTKKRSLAEAQKKAVERVVGVFISAKTRVAQSVTVNQNILADVKGYIQKYDVVSEKQEDGFYKTRIRALVLYQKVGEDLESLGLMRPPPPPGNPVVSVRVGEAGSMAADKAASAVRKVFVDKGFTVVVADEKEPDLIVKGSALASELKDVRLGGFVSFRARAELEVVKARTGEVLARKTREASGLDPTRSIAEAKAYENAASLAGEELAAELTGLLTSRVKVTVRVSGLSGLDAVQGLADDLRLQPDIAAATLSVFREGGAELLVTTEGMAGEELGALLLRMKKYGFKTGDVTPYLVEVRAAK